MSLPVNIEDAVTKQTAKVTENKALLVSVLPYPALGEQKSRVFRQYFTSTGLSTGSNDMGVDGSSTPANFFIPASATDDRYIANLSFIVGYGTTGEPHEFADGTVLTNGVRLYYVSDQGEIDVHDGIKSNQDLLRMSLAPVTSTWEVRHVNATNDYGYFVSMDLTKVQPPYGLKLDAGSNQRLYLTVRDNATNADSFNCIAYGFDRFK